MARQRDILNMAREHSLRWARELERTPDLYGRSPAADAVADVQRARQELERVTRARGLHPETIDRIETWRGQPVDRNTSAGVWDEIREYLERYGPEAFSAQYMNNFSLEPGAVNHATDAFAYPMTASEVRRRERMRGRTVEPFESLTVRCDECPDVVAGLQITTSMGTRQYERRESTVVDRRELEASPDVMRAVAREHSLRWARELERTIFENLMSGMAQRDSHVAETYGYARDAMMHGLRDQIGGVIEVKEDEAEEIEWLKSYPEKIEFGSITAHLLNDTYKVYKEGLDLRHCMKKRHYTMGIRGGRYIAYHIDVPKRICKSGMTLSYERDRNGPRETWNFHMCKGKANSYQRDAELDAFYEHAKEVINNVEEKSDGKTVGISEGGKRGRERPGLQV